jgi:hypothetical protein
MLKVSGQNYIRVTAKFFSEHSSRANWPLVEWREAIALAGKLSPVSKTLMRILRAAKYRRAKSYMDDGGSE